MDCSHKKTSKKMVKTDYFGLAFSAKMEVCDTCDAHLWTNESKHKFNDWLIEQKKNHFADKYARD